MSQVIQAADEQLEAALRARPAVRGLRCHRPRRTHRGSHFPPGVGHWVLMGFGFRALSFNMARMSSARMRFLRYLRFVSVFVALVLPSAIHSPCDKRAMAAMGAPRLKHSNLP